MRVLLATAVLAFLVAAAGCGGSSDSGSATKAATEASQEASTTAASDATTEETESSDSEAAESSKAASEALDAAGFSEGCKKVAELSLALSAAFGSATSGTGADDVENTAEAYTKVADDAPEEIRGAFKTIAVALAKFAEVSKKLNLSSGATPDADALTKLAEASTETFDNPEFKKAGEAIEKWATENCAAATGG